MDTCWAWSLIKIAIIFDTVVWRFYKRIKHKQFLIAVHIQMHKRHKFIFCWPPLIDISIYIYPYQKYQFCEIRPILSFSNFCLLFCFFQHHKYMFDFIQIQVEWVIKDDQAISDLDFVLNVCRTYLFGKSLISYLI